MAFLSGSLKDLQMAVWKVGPTDSPWVACLADQKEISRVEMMAVVKADAMVVLMASWKVLPMAASWEILTAEQRDYETAVAKVATTD